MISKLPRWVGGGAWALAFVAGMVNMVGLLGFEHQAISHVTGTTSRLAVAVNELDLRSALQLAAILGSFVIGTIASGFLIQDSTLRLGRRYGVALLLESILLAVAVPLLEANHPFGIYSASCACGLQNAMASTYSGAVVRTTHLTGMFTDIGILIGQSARGLPVDLRRARLYGLIIFGFLCGGVVGAAIFGRLGYSALYVPSGLLAFAAVAYAIYRTRKASAPSPSSK